MIGWISFFTFIIFSILISILIIKYKSITFADMMTALMASFLSFVFDMIFCKQLYTYNYVDSNYAGINSFLIGLTVFPSISLIFTTYLPKNGNHIPRYILIWSLSLTIIEILVTPLKIVEYHGWKILPWSLLLYLIVFTFLYYFRTIIKRYSKSQ